MRCTLFAAMLLAALAASAPVATAAKPAYKVPDGNPFVGQAGARAEIYAYGLRNPWRFSFDRATGDLVVSDVGQNAIEEVNFALRGQGAGSNYGWNCFEGSRPYANAPEGCVAPGHVPPVLEYSSGGAAPQCSVIGGYVVRDPALPIGGRYVYGDFCTGELRSAVLAPGGATDDQPLNLDHPGLSTFGEDAAGRIYAGSIGGGVVRLAGLPGGLVALEPVAAFAAPVTYVTAPPNDHQRLFVTEQTGAIRLIRDGLVQPEPFLDLTGTVSTNNLERGVLSMAFAPDYATSRRFYVAYTDPNGDVTIDEFLRSATDPDRADPASRRNLLSVEHRQFGNHNAGQLQFGPDGLLYATIGDGGGAGDPNGNAQNLSTLLGKLIRIDPLPPGSNGKRKPR
ncbi:MAG TPA: PQQ-dependent sugar dehydrogenase [Solirubrobacteraceae bacterium]|nr:PQQ-dependent sugar dehydrogenase [Solirubrobacteraceae bacterium]